jgi:hypothetical protein
MKRGVLASVAVLGALFLSSSMAAAADHWLGSWKLDPAKSSYGKGPAPKSQTLKWEAAGAEIKFVSDGVDADGKATHSAFTSNFDGHDVAYTGNPNADTASPKRVDADNYTNTWKLKGKVTVSAKVMVAKDGKSLTVTQSGTDAKGEAVNITAVFDRQ